MSPSMETSHKLYLDMNVWTGRILDVSDYVTHVNDISSSV